MNAWGDHWRLAGVGTLTEAGFRRDDGREHEPGQQLVEHPYPSTGPGQRFFVVLIVASIITAVADEGVPSDGAAEANLHVSR
jgi:hypothetical protein